MSTTISEDLVLIDEYVNEGVVQFLKDTKANVEMAYMVMDAGIGDYLLDSDAIAFTDFWYEPADGDRGRLLEEIDSAEMEEMRQAQNTVTGEGPMYYALQGANLVKFWPYPESSSDRLNSLYVPRPTSSLTADAHDPSAEGYGRIPKEYHPIILEYALWRACESEDHRPSDYGLKHQAAYERGIARIKADINKKAGMRKGGAVWGRKRKPFPLTPGTDVRV